MSSIIANSSVYREVGMEAVLRRLKLKKGEPQDTEARRRLQQDLFAFDHVSNFCIFLAFPADVVGHALLSENRQTTF